MAQVWLGAAVMKPSIPTPPSLREFPPDGFAQTGSGPRVLLAYEDFELGLRAMDLFVSISRNAGADREAQVSLWRFDFFACPEWRDAAAVQAERADVIILSIRHYDDISDPVRTWLEKGIQRRKLSPGALVIAFDSATSARAVDSPITAYLQALARAGGMDFFCGGLARNDDGCDTGISGPLAAAHATFDRASEYQPTRTRWGTQWGLNE
jgi:hypothetical protein